MISAEQGEEIDENIAAILPIANKAREPAAKKFPRIEEPITRYMAVPTNLFWPRCSRAALGQVAKMLSMPEHEARGGQGRREPDDQMYAPASPRKSSRTCGSF